MSPKKINSAVSSMKENWAETTENKLQYFWVNKTFHIEQKLAKAFTFMTFCYS